MNPDTFFTPLDGLSLLIPGQSESVRGQCVQSVGLWVEALGIQFPAHTYAYQYYVAGIPGYTQVPAGQPIEEGDIVIWGANFPSSLNAGHIDVASAIGTTQDFWAWDSNWSPPLKLAKIHHKGDSNKYIVGYLRGGSMYNGKTAEEWANEAASATSIAEVRAAYVAQLCEASGVNPDHPLEQVDVNLAVANIDELNRKANATYTTYTGAQLFVEQKSES